MNTKLDIFCHILKWFQIQAAGNLARLTLLCIARIIRNQQNHTLTTWRLLGDKFSGWTIFQAGFRTLRRCRENLICGVLFNVIEFSASSAIKCCTCKTAILCASSLVIQYVHLDSLAIGKKELPVRTMQVFIGKVSSYSIQNNSVSQIGITWYYSWNSIKNEAYYLTI